ncbi:CHASE3 domain-containing protein [Pseudonocardia sp. RS010]|uniref:CHASE3 domain-containing protein n=1 Tax=Pseudonocardia sp. RS010 TaxID=3385979 RepID=UPI00399F036A
MRRPRPGRRSLRRRIQILVGGVLATVLALLAVALVSSWQAAAADRVVIERLGPAATSLERLQSAYVDQETGLRGFVLTGQEPFLEPYTAAEPVIAAEQRRLRDALPEHTGMLDEVAAAHEDWSTNVARLGLELRRAGDMDRILAMVGQGVGKSRFDALRARLDAVRTQVELEAAAAQGHADAARARVTTVLVAAGVLTVLLGVAALVFLRRWVITPLDRLVDDVSQVAGGRYGHPIRDDGLLELATVGRGVGLMRDRLTAHAADAAALARRDGGAAESERMAGELREDVLLELSSITMAVTAAGARHPDSAQDLRPVVDRLDEVIRTTSTAIFGRPGAEPDREQGG